MDKLSRAAQGASIAALKMSGAHIAAFRRLYSANARPIQPRPDWCLVPAQHVPAGVASGGPVEAEGVVDAAPR